ncbi:lipopolysaccharide biosynthesis protein [Endozoicomonadaceae bacterium StTr2]
MEIKPNNTMDRFSQLKKLSILVFNSFFASGLSYFLTLAIANKLGPTDFGEYSYILLWGNLFTILSIYGTDSTAAPLYAKTKSLSTAFNNIYIFRIVIVLFLAGVLALTSITDITFSLGVFAITLTSLNTAFLYELKDRNEKYAYIYTFERLIYICLTFLLISQPSLKIDHIFIILVFSFIVSLLIQAKHHSENFKKLSLEKIKGSINILRDNFYIVLITASNYAYGGFSRIILKGVYSAKALGIYSAAWQFILVATIFQASVDRIWRKDLTDSLIHRDYEKSIKSIKSYIFFTTIPIMIGACILNLFAEQIVSILFNETYRSMTDLIPSISIYFIIVNLNSIATISWIAIGKKTHYIYINIFFSILLLTILTLTSHSLTLSGFVSTVVLIHGLNVISLIYILYKPLFNSYFRKA